MMQECDFTSEARNIATFSSYLDQNDLRRIATAPFVYSQLTSKRWAHRLYQPAHPLDVHMMCLDRWQ